MPFTVRALHVGGALVSTCFKLCRLARGADDLPRFLLRLRMNHAIRFVDWSDVLLRSRRQNADRRSSRCGPLGNLRRGLGLGLGLGIVIRAGAQPEPCQ